MIEKLRGLRRSKLSYVVGLFLSGLLLGVSLWNWALWYQGFHVYYLPPYWHCRVGENPTCPEPNDLGFWVNVQYLQIAIAFILAIACTYRIAKECNSYKRYNRSLKEDANH